MEEAAARYLCTPKTADTVKHADNALRTQALLLAMKALDVISKTLDIIAADDAVPVAPAPSGAPAAGCWPPARAGGRSRAATDGMPKLWRLPRPHQRR